MRLQEHLQASHATGLSRRPLHTTSDPSTASHGTAVRPRHRLCALAVVFLLTPLAGPRLFAQAPPEPDANLDQPYRAEYGPGQQTGNAPQPYLAQSQPSYDAYSPAGPTAFAGSGQPLTADQLEQLVAPIALYPDPLVALVLAASTYPGQVADADAWRQTQGNAPAGQIAAGADVQNWDPSLKALTAFPQVLFEMDQNLQWTSVLGNAYYNQPQDVLQAVQVMRQRAQAAGNLQSTPQEAVSYNQGNIQVLPANPEVVYVPAYNPWMAYGQPVSPYPGFSLAGALGSAFNDSGFNSSVVRFGLGMVMTAFTHSNWGFLGWGLNWLTQNVLFHQSNYYSHSTSVADWGLPRGGPRAFGRQAAFARASVDSYRTQGSRTQAGYDQRGYGYDNRAPSGQGFVRSPGNYGSNWRSEASSRPYPAPALGNPRSPVSAYNRASLPTSRPQVYSRDSYTSALYSNPRQNYAIRPGQAYGNSLQAYNRNPAPISRTQSYSRPGDGFNSHNGSGFTNGSSFTTRPGSSRFGSAYASRATPAYGAYGASTFQRTDYGQRSTSMGNSFMGSAAKPPKSGGFHLFGGGRSAKSFSGAGFSGGGHESKAFGSGKSFGGHSGGFHPFGGGHHSSGGGHSGHGAHHR